MPQRIHATFAMRNRGAGAPAEFDLWMYLRFRDDLLVEAAFYVDVAKAARLLPAGVVEVHARDRVRQESRPGQCRRERRAVRSATRRRRRSGARKARRRTLGTASGWSAWPAIYSLCGRKATSRGCWRGWRPDFNYNPRGDWTKPPLIADPCDRADFAESLRLVNIEFEDLGGEIHELLVDGDRVVAHRTIRLRNRGAGDIAHVDEWVCFRVRDGLIVEMASYVDNAGVAGVAWPDYTPPR